MALLTAPARTNGPAGGGAVAPGRPGRQRLAARLASTPGRFTLMMTALLLLGLLAGVAAMVGAVQRAGQVDAVRGRTGPLTVTAQQLYRSLSDADATAAAAFLSSGAEPPALRARYQADIAAASAALASAGSASESDQRAVAEISAALPVYTGLVETARANNRLNLPLGAAYLREASTLMQGTLLRNAKQLYTAETGQLAADRGGAGELPWLALPLVLLTLGGLVIAQIALQRRTHRVFNLGLLAATAAGLVLLLWLSISWAGSASHLESGRAAGSAQVDVLAQARIAALGARADEALTLVAHGNGASYEKDFTAQLNELAGGDGTGGLLARARREASDPSVRAALDTAARAVGDWRTVHVKLRGLDESGKYPDAVSLTIGADPASAATRFNQVDTALAGAIGTASASFDRQAGAAASALAGTGVGFAVLTLILLAALVTGFQRRIAEYR